MTNSNPPADVTFAAVVVQTWLDKQQPGGQGKLSVEQVAKMSPADRIDYCRRFDQTNMPAWKDPRGT
jgi:hypothetical protein